MKINPHITYNHIIQEETKFNIFKLNISGIEKLLNLDKSGFYIEPLNKNFRGGSRFIFSSKYLSDLLYKRLQVAFKRVSDKKFDNKNFIGVNSVFRYNKFTPDDGKFISHYDTPFYDSDKQIYSRYTLIIYLINQKKRDSDPCLTIETYKFNNHDYNSIIFDQKYEHAGYPYKNRDKIFIRTELLFNINDNIKYDKECAKLFNISCYMTKHSIFNSDIAEYMNDTFNKVNKMRYEENNNKNEMIYLLKTFNNINFITNGNNYWFKHIDLKKNSNDCNIRLFQW